MESEGAGRRRDVSATLGIVAIFVTIVAGRPLWRRLARHPTPERCAAMLDRYAEQQARAYERTSSVSAVPRPLGSPEVVRCVRDFTDDEVRCALAAGYVDELERCFSP